MPRHKDLNTLRKAFKEKNLTLYLGAGVSVGNSLPTWDKLIAMMYFKAISDRKLEGWRPYPNYLFAIAEWHLKHSNEPLDVLARRLQKYYADSGIFLTHLKHTLYEAFTYTYGEQIHKPECRNIRSANATMDAVAKLCDDRTKGVRSVITYNYDSLLELVLGPKAEPIYAVGATPENGLPIYHVHGYVPITGEGSAPEDVIFTEDQYHRIAEDVYSWSNLIQIQALCRSVGLMVGLSLTDRNMRRLLDAIAKSPVRSQCFALLQRPKRTVPKPTDLDSIHHKAIEYLGDFEKSGMKKDYLEMSRDCVMYSRSGVKSSRPVRSGGIKGSRYQMEIASILEAVHSLQEEEQSFVFDRLGITPIWYDEHCEVPDILAAVNSNS